MKNLKVQQSPGSTPLHEGLDFVCTYKRSKDMGLKTTGWFSLLINSSWCN